MHLYTWILQWFLPRRTFEFRRRCYGMIVRCLIVPAGLDLYCIALRTAEKARLVHQKPFIVIALAVACRQHGRAAPRCCGMRRHRIRYKWMKQRAWAWAWALCYATSSSERRRRRHRAPRPDYGVLDRQHRLSRPPSPDERGASSFPCDIATSAFSRRSHRQPRQHRQHLDIYAHVQQVLVGNFDNFGCIMCDANLLRGTLDDAQTLTSKHRLYRRNK